jgi:hypothetical protein
MKTIKSANYAYSSTGDITECTVTYSDGTKQTFKTPSEFTMVQEQLKNQQKQFLVE